MLIRHGVYLVHAMHTQEGIEGEGRWLVTSVRSIDRAMHRYVSVTAVVSAVSTYGRDDGLQGLQETTGAASTRRLGGPNSAFVHDS